MFRPTLLLILAAALLPAQVSFDRLVRAADTPQDWLNYSGGSASATARSIRSRART